MKNKIECVKKLSLLAALIAVIGFAFTACKGTDAAAEPSTRVFSGFTENDEYRLIILDPDARAALTPGDKYILVIINSGGDLTGTSTGTVSKVERGEFTLKPEKAEETFAIKTTGRGAMGAIESISAGNSGKITLDEGVEITPPPTLTPKLDNKNALDASAILTIKGLSNYDGRKIEGYSLDDTYTVCRTYERFPDNSWSTSPEPIVNGSATPRLFDFNKSKVQNGTFSFYFFIGNDITGIANNVKITNGSGVCEFDNIPRKVTVTGFNTYYKDKWINFDVRTEDGALFASPFAWKYKDEYHGWGAGRGGDEDSVKLILFKSEDFSVFTGSGTYNFVFEVSVDGNKETGHANGVKVTNGACTIPFIKG